MIEPGTTTDDVGPRPPLDPELAAALVIVKPPELNTIADVYSFREAADTLRIADRELRRNGAFTVEERSVPGPGGAPDVSLLICRPTGAATLVPAIYHAHGGGMVSCHNRTGIAELMDWAEELDLAVVSVEYRLAPETRHPGPVEDCYAGLVWTAEHTDELGIDRERIVVAGASSGGGLAAALALMARDRGGPALAGQLLECPMLDDRNDTPSAIQTVVGTYTRASNETCWNALLGDARGTSDVSPYAAPARATDLSGLPPAFIDVGSAEVFRDEAVAYASRIWRAGGQAELHVWPGAFHDFDLLVPQAALSQDARVARLRWLRRLVGT